MKTARRLFQEQLKAAPPAGEKYVGTLETKAGDVVFHKYQAPTGTPKTPQGKRLRVFGVRNSSGGYGKGLFRSLTPQEKEEEAESANSSPFKVRRQLSLPPIRGEAEKFEGSDSPQPSVSKLAKKMKKLRKENEELRTRDAERRVKIADLRRGFDILSHGLCAKFKGAFKEMGK